MAKRAKKSTAKKTATKKTTKKASKKSKPRPKGKKDDCFITTSCVKYYGLPDDCYQLTSLRNFRDTILTKSSKGKFLIKQYYSVAPEIVSHLEEDRSSDLIFRKIFEGINNACEAIERREYSIAIDIYTQIVSSLVNHFKIRHKWQ